MVVRKNSGTTDPLGLAGGTAGGLQKDRINLVVREVVDHDHQRLAREVVNDAERGELSMAFHVAALADHRPSGTKRISFASLCTLRNSASR